MIVIIQFCLHYPLKHTHNDVDTGDLKASLLQNHHQRISIRLNVILAVGKRSNYAKNLNTAPPDTKTQNHLVEKKGTYTPTC